ncbi:MAG: BON domain-containing protein [Syntrophaceae bacterium]
MIYKQFILFLLSMLVTACALPFGGGPLQQLYSTVARKSYEIAQEERTPVALALDNKIVLSLTDKFTQDSAINLLDVSPYSYNGRVYLIGVHETDEEWTRAIEIAAREEGVKSITTYILLKGEPPNCGLLNNFMLYANVRAKLIEDKVVRSTNIDIKALQCHVVLLGIVASSDEIDRAITHARGAEGVVRVQSFLEATRMRAIVDAVTEPTVLP